MNRVLSVYLWSKERVLVYIAFYAVQFNIFRIHIIGCMTIMFECTCIYACIYCMYVRVYDVCFKKHFLNALQNKVF